MALEVAKDTQMSMDLVNESALEMALEVTKDTQM